MLQSTLRRARGYGIAVLAVLVATLARMALDPALGQRQPFVAFFFAVVVASWFGGLGPSTLALALGGLSGAAFFFAPVRSPRLAAVADWMAMGTYLVVGAAVVAFGEGQRVARRRREREAAERRRVEGELRESEGRFRQLAETIGDVFWMRDPRRRRVLYVSPAYEAIWGRSCEALSADFGEWLAGIHDEDRPRVEAAFFGQALLGGYDQQYRVERPDGTTRWVRDRGYPVRDGSGEVVRVAGIAEDITDRRRSEQTARRLKALSDHANDALFVVGEDGGILDANEVACEWLGYDRGRLLTLGVPDIDPIYQVDRFRDLFGRALRERVPPFESLLRRRDGTTLPVEICAVAQRFEGEAYLFAVVRDIAERRRREEELRASEARFRQLAEAMPQIVWVADPTGRNVYVNRHWSDSTGQPTREGLGDRWPEFVHPDDRTGLRAAWEACQRDGTAYAAEYRLRGKDGRYRWHVVRGVPVRDVEGRIARWYGSSTDIDESKRLAEALRGADRRKDEFIATLAHELRNPLAPIRNAVQLLRSQCPPDPELSWAQDVIERQLAQMSRLLDDLLDVARISRCKLELRKARVALAEVVDAAVETSLPSIEAGGHELTCTLPPGPVVLDADPVRLAQVFSNLLTNAAKYTEPGGHIRLVAGRRGREVVVSVQDDGIGLDAEHLGRIFEIFSQEGPALDRSQGGLGIGLSLVKGLVELHGGSVEARSDGPGRGSEFLVHLPVSGAIPEADPAGPTAGGRAVDPGPEGKARILLVDDNVDAARTLGRLLKLAGNEVRVVHDGPAALELARQFRPEAVVLDIGLPGIDGFEVARRLRALPGGAQVTLIALTGWGQESDRRRSHEAGFDHHLVKPVAPADLIALLRTTTPSPQPAGGC